MKNSFQFLLLLLIYPMILCFKSSDTASVSSRSNSAVETKLLVTANDFSEKGKYKEALIFFDSATRLAAEKKNWEVYVKANNGATHAALGLAKFEDAKKYIERALDKGIKYLGQNHSEVALAYNERGIVHFNEGDFDEALEDLLLSLSIRKKIFGTKLVPALGESYNNLAICYYVKGDYEEVYRCVQKCLEVVLKTIGKDSPEASSAYSKLSSYYEKCGDYNSALLLAQKVLQIRLKSGVDFSGDLAKAYNSVGLCYFQLGKYKEALQNYEAAKNIYLKIVEKGGVPTLEMIYYYIASVYSRQKEYKKESECYQKAFQFLDKVKKTDTFNAAVVYGNAATCYLNLGDTANFLDKTKKALEIYKKILGEKNKQSVAVYNKIGNYYFKKNNPDFALHYYQKGLTTLLKDFNSSNPLNNPSMVRIEDPEGTLGSALHLKAQAFKQKFEQNRSEVQYLEKCYETYLKALEASEYARQNLITYESQIRVLGQSSELCASAADVAYELYRLKKDKKYIREMFFLSEKSKSALLKEALTDKKAKYFAGIPKNLSERERKLKIDINYYEKRLSEAGQRESPRVKAFRDKLIAKKHEYEQLVTMYKERYPEYYNLKFKEAPKSIELIREKLPAKSVVIEYFLTKDAVNIFLIGPKVFHMARVKTDSSLYRFASEFRSIFATASDDALHRYIKNGGELYRKLIKPIERFLDTTSVTHITIIPDGYLSYIPLDVLPDREPKSITSFRNMPYMLKKYAVSYAYTAFPYTYTPERKDLSEKVLTFCPFGKEQPNLMTTENRAKYAVLPYSKKEVASIAEVYKSTDLYQYEASEKNFKKDASNYRMIHLATHAFLNEKNPMFSGLLLAKDSVDDGMLYLYELYQMRLNSELVVLSACNTGFGAIQYGEGLMSLGRAFAYAGCPSIMVSLWQANDYASAELMKYFYEGLKHGQGKDEALRLAKLRYLKSADNVKAHPLFWAGYIQFGNTEPIGQHKSGWWYLPFIVIGGVLTWFLFRRIRRMRAS